MAAAQVHRPFKAAEAVAAITGSNRFDPSGACSSRYGYKSSMVSGEMLSFSS